VPEPESLPSVEEMLAGDTATAPPTTAEPPRDPSGDPSRDLPVGVPSPARAEPHDATAWLPLPDVNGLPPIEELLVPAAPVEVAPSPARAEPHDPAAWLPLPDVDALPEVDAGGTTGTPRARARSHRAPRRRRATRYALSAFLVLATVAAAGYGASRVLSNGDNVELRVDGQTISSQTGVSTVGSFLREQGVTLGQYDRVVPSANTPIDNGMQVRVLRAFPVAVDLDGTITQKYTTHHDPQQFLADLKLGPQVVVSSAPPSIVANGAPVVLRTKKEGVLIVDGQPVKYNIAADTVKELLDHFKVVLGPSDITKPVGVNDTLPPNAAISVVRVATETQQAVEPYTVPDQTVFDPTIDVMAAPTVTAAKPGTQTVTYSIVRHNGTIVSKLPISAVPIVPATPKITTYGAKYDPRWDKIADCETAGQWNRVKQTYQGGLGIYYKNWLYYRNKDWPRNAGLATKLQQIIVAERIKKDHGFKAWGCGKTLGYAKEDGKRLP
jgi:resuscitation-promoting factor RpfB